MSGNCVFVLAVTIGVGETFFPGVFGNGPHVFACAIVAAGKFQDFFCDVRVMRRGLLILAWLMLVL